MIVLLKFCFFSISTDASAFTQSIFRHMELFKLGRFFEILNSSPSRSYFVLANLSNRLLKHTEFCPVVLYLRYFPRFLTICLKI